MTGRLLRGWVAVVAALGAVISGAGMIGYAAGVPGQSRVNRPGVAERALEPGFTGTVLYRNDNFRTGQNLAETVLTPSAVNSENFGLQFTDAVDGYIYAEPLYVPNVAIPKQGTHNVVYVATENDSVYAFDADAAGPPLWQTSFINPGSGVTAVPSSDLGNNCTDLIPIIGITATPVIDPGTGTLYVVSKVKLGPGNYQQQLHALDITTGLERPNSPVTITATAKGTAADGVNGTITFDPLLQNDRPALTLANGVVYLSFASHCDITPFHGWILGYDETTLAQAIVYNPTVNGADGGIWQSGCGPGVDTNGDLIAITGNGTFDTGASPVDYGDSFLRLTPGVGTTGTMTVASSFTPLDETLLDDEDLDMGSGGNLLLPDQPGPNPHLMIGIGKLGSIYLVNRDDMGGFNASMDQMVQELLDEVGGMFSTPAYWQGEVPNVGLQNMIYTIGVNDQPRMFVIANGLIQTPPASVATNFTFGFPGASPVISANGTTGGIMWAISTSNYAAGGTAVLYAFDATNLQTELYDSNQFSSDNPGPAVKFSVPTVANGSVYVGTQTQLAVFGLFPAGRGNPTPTATLTATASATITATATATITATATATITATSSATPTASASITATPTASITATPSATPTPSITATPTATLTPSITATPTATLTPSISATLTATPTASPTPVVGTLEVSPRSISFSDQVVGHQSNAAKIVVIHSTGLTPVTMWEPTVSSGFVVTSSDCSAQLQPGASCTIHVAFVPTVRGKQNGQLQVNSNAKFGVHTIKLRGKGLAPKVKIRPKSLSFEAEATCDTLAANGGTCTHR